MVEAFRRIVRFRRASEGQMPSRAAMLAILRDQIAGIELNPHAARVAAFSLYLAFLHTQEPPAIRRNKHLPHLLYDERREASSDDYDVLLCANSFDVAATISDLEVRRRFGSGCAQVVVGNPPWGKTGQGGALVVAAAQKWCDERDLPVGGGEPSQRFLYRALDLLEEGGRCGFLVSAGILLKQEKESRQFRRRWLREITLHQVTNFTHVRRVFFKGAVSPFISVVWSKGRPQNDTSVCYWSAKKTALVNQNQVVVLSRTDLRVVSQIELMEDDRLWKVYWWGGHHDAALLSALRLYPELQSHENLWNGKSGRGFNENDGRKKKPPVWDLKELPVNQFSRFGEVTEKQLVKTPELMSLCRQERLFTGLRLLIKGAPSRKEDSFYEIVARVDEQSYAVRHSIYSFPMQDSPENRELAQVVLGVLWSSLTLYYLFLSEGRFGIWFEQINLEEFQYLPLPPLETSKRGTDLQRQIASIVRQLGQTPGERNLFSEGEGDLVARLDEAVFDLYELSSRERDLVRDMCEVGFDLLANGPKSDALKPIARSLDKPRVGFAKNLDKYAPRSDLDCYLRAFLDFWDAQLTSDEIEVGWQIVGRPGQYGELSSGSVIGVRFGICYRKEHEAWLQELASQEEWQQVLTEFVSSNQVPMSVWDVQIQGLTRIVSASDVLILKRNERRLWTPSAAYEDAEAALLQLWHRQELEIPTGAGATP